VEPRKEEGKKERKFRDGILPSEVKLNFVENSLP
jgi:hypothetical protein